MLVGAVSLLLVLGFLRDTLENSPLNFLAVEVFIAPEKDRDLEWLRPRRSSVLERLLPRPRGKASVHARLLPR